MYELEIELEDDFYLEEELPNFKEMTSQKRFWVYKTSYKGKISYIIVDMKEKNRYLFFDDSSTLGIIYMLEEGEIFDIEYQADFNDWNLYINKFPERKKMANLVCVIIGADIEKEDE